MIIIRRLIRKSSPAIGTMTISGGVRAKSRRLPAVRNMIHRFIRFFGLASILFSVDSFGQTKPTVVRQEAGRVFSVSMTSGSSSNTPMWIVWSGTQPVAVLNSTVSLNGIELLATAANQASGNASLTALESLLAQSRIFHVVSASGSAANAWYVQFPAAQSVTGPLTDAQLRASLAGVAFSSGSYSNPFYTVSTNTIISGAVSVTSSGTVVTTGTITVYAPSGQALPFVSTTPIILGAGAANFGRVNGSTIAVQCLNAAGTAFESCAGGASGGVASVFVSSGFVSIISTFSASNPGWVNINQGTMAVTGLNGAPVATLSTATARATAAAPTYGEGANSPLSTDLAGNLRITGSISVSPTPGPVTITPGTGTYSVALASVTYTGTSMNINCTGGCGSPTQAASFVAVATVTLLTGGTHYILMNHPGSTATVKVQRVEVGVYGDAAVTGVVTGFHLYLISNATATAVGSRNARVFRMDATKNAIANGITVSTGGSSSNPTMLFSSAFAGVQMTSEETTLTQAQTLYDYRNLGDTPLRLAAGNGIAVKQAGQPVAAAGKVIIRTFFTQE